MIWIYGASGHGKVIMDLLESMGIPLEGFLDDNENIQGFMGYNVLVPERLTDPSAQVIIAVGDNSTRRIIAEKNNFRYMKAVHPTAVISPHTEIDAGTVVMARTVVQPGSVIGKHVIINTGALVDHDCIIGDFTHISPGVTLCGNVDVGEGTWIGAGSTVIQGIKIGKNVVIGAGSLIRKNVPDNVLVVGNPQRISRKFTI